MLSTDSSTRVVREALIIDKPGTIAIGNCHDFVKQFAPTTHGIPLWAVNEEPASGLKFLLHHASEKSNAPSLLRIITELPSNKPQIVDC